MHFCPDEKLHKVNDWVISHEIRPIAVLYPPPHKNVLLNPFLLYEYKKICEGYNAARGLSSRDIANNFTLIKLVGLFSRIQVITNKC